MNHQPTITSPWRRRVIAAAVAGASLAAPLALQPGAAEASGTRGFMTAVVSSNTLYDAFATTGAVTMTHPATGRYTIRAAGLTGSGTAQLTMIDTGSNPPVCTVSSVAAASNSTTLRVRCTDPGTGLPADGDFTVMFSSLRNLDASYGYVRFATSGTGSATPSNQFRSRGTGKAKVQRTSVGSYTVTIPNETFSTNVGVMMVSAIGTPVRYCTVGSWGQSGANTLVFLNCYDRQGNLANSRFSLIASERSLVPSISGGGAAWSSSYGRTGSLAPIGTGYSFNFAGATNLHKNGVSTGQVTVVIPDVDTIADSFTVQHVVGYNGNYRCAIDGTPALVPLGDDLYLRVMCRGITGVPVTTSFDVFGDLIATL